MIPRALSAGLVALACVSCGDPEPSSPRTHPVDIGPGEIGTVVGTGARATDPLDGNADGTVDPAIPAFDANLDTPMDMTVSPSGQLFVIDWNGHKVRVLEGGMVSFFVGTGIEGDACEGALVNGDCPKDLAQLNHPTDVTFDAEGRLWIAAWHNAKMKRVDPADGLLENVCGTGLRNFSGDGGQCRDAGNVDLVSFDLPSGVVVDPSGNVFLSDQANQVIRRIGADGIVKTVAGNCPPGGGGFGCLSGQGYSGDDGPATAAHLSNEVSQSTDPQGKIALDGSGNLYIADTGNDVIRRVTPGADGVVGDGDPLEEIITTVAGTGEAGYSGDDGPARSAMLNGPTDIDVAEDGTLYIADRGNSCVRAVAPDGIIRTVAGRCGSPGFSGDGELATEAELWTPYGIELDGAGGLYIADTRNHCIRKVLLP